VNVVFHEAAAIELDEAVVYYQAISRDLSADFRADAERATERIAEQPEAWPPMGHAAA
jgi:hypothetical protein